MWRCSSLLNYGRNCSPILGSSGGSPGYVLTVVNGAMMDCALKELGTTKENIVLIRRSFGGSWFGDGRNTTALDWLQGVHDMVVFIRVGAKNTMR